MRNKYTATIPPADLSNLDEDQIEIYYAMMESIGRFRLGIEQLEGAESSNWQIRELNELHIQLEEVVSQAVPGENGTPSSTILTAIEPVEDYIYRISASLSDIDYYSVQTIQNALDTMYQAIGSLKSMAETYYPEVSSQQPVEEDTTVEVTEAEQELEQKEEEVKYTIDTTIDSELSQEEKKKNIDDSLNEIAYTAVYSVLVKFKDYGYKDLATNEEAKMQCYEKVLDSFLEITNESALSNYVNKETLESDAQYISSYYFNQLANTIIEWG